MSYPTRVLRCSTCNLPFAKMENGVLIVESAHRGQKHVNVVAISELVRLRMASELDSDIVWRRSDDDRLVMTPAGLCIRCECGNLVLVLGDDYDTCRVCKRHYRIRLQVGQIEEPVC